MEINVKEFLIIEKKQEAVTTDIHYKNTTPCYHLDF